MVSGFEPGWLVEVLRYAVGAVAALVLLQAANGTMLGFSRLTCDKNGWAKPYVTSPRITVDVQD